MSKLEILNISGIDCYEKDGAVYLKLEAVARGLGFTRVAASGNEVVRWGTVRKYLSELGVPTCWHDDSPANWGKDVATCCDEDFQLVGKAGLPDFIPENIFYRLAMKAKNETAEKFQALVADEVIPSIRKHGAYMTDDTLDRMINSPEFGIKLLTALKEEKDKRKALEVANSELSVQNAIMAPKADYFDDLVDRHLLTSFRDTAKELGIPPKAFVGWLLEKKYLYRDQKHKLVPYENKNNGLFEVRESKNDKTGWAGTQTLVTPKGRETFRLLYLGM